MEDYQKRVIGEKAELDAKLEKLQTFLVKQFHFNAEEMEITSDELNRLKRQAEVMAKYSKILGDTKPPNTTNDSSELDKQKTITGRSANGRLNNNEGK